MRLSALPSDGGEGEGDGSADGAGGDGVSGEVMGNGSEGKEATAAEGLLSGAAGPSPAADLRREPTYGYDSRGRAMWKKRGNPKGYVSPRDAEGNLITKSGEVDGRRGGNLKRRLVKVPPGKSKDAIRTVCKACGVVFWRSKYEDRGRGMTCSPSCATVWTHRRVGRQHAHLATVRAQVDADLMNGLAGRKVGVARLSNFDEFNARRREAKEKEVVEKVEAVGPESVYAAGGDKAVVGDVVAESVAPVVAAGPVAPVVQVRKDFSEMTRDEKLKLLEEVEQAEAAAVRKIEAAKAEDPFWFYEPSSGENVPDEKWAFLRGQFRAEDVPVRLTGQVDVHRSTAPIRMVLGGNQCLGGETRIFDPVAGIARRVDEIDGPFHVHAWDGEKIVVAQAERPFMKERDKIFSFEMSNGRSFAASLGHLVLSQFGYVACERLRPGFALSLPASISGFVQEVPDGDGRSSSRTIFAPFFRTSESLEVTRVTYLREDVKWDFHVPIHNNYLCAGVIHHNSGKTCSTTIEALIFATGCVPESLKGIYPEERLAGRTGPVAVRVVAKDWENGALLNVLPTYQKWVPREFLLDGKWEKSWSAERSTLYLGRKGRLSGTIEFMSNAQQVTSFQGPPRDMVVYDEEPRRDIYKENLMRFTTRGGVNILFGMTPTEGLTWVWDQVVNRGEDESGNRVEVFKLPSVVNPRSSVDVLREAAKDFTYEEKKMRFLGEFISLSGLVYGRLFDRKIHLIEPFDTACDCGGRDVHAEACPWTQYYVVRGMDPHLVTPTAMVWVALDRMGNAYVDRCWFEESDIDEVKAGAAARSNGMRLGWSVTDSAADSDIAAFSGLNVFKKLTTGANKIRALRLAAKGQGSIKTGVDELKQWLKPHPRTGRPRLYIMDKPENRPLVMAFETMERDKYQNEDKRGMKDKILESKHHLHAALRYVFMQNLKWLPPQDAEYPTVPAYQADEVMA